MICYRDKTYCSSEVKEHICGREFTKEDVEKAKEWWGSDDYPVAYRKFCEEEDSTT